PDAVRASLHHLCLQFLWDQVMNQASLLASLALRIASFGTVTQRLQEASAHFQLMKLQLESPYKTRFGSEFWTPSLRPHCYGAAAIRLVTFKHTKASTRW